jgi:hypothetical protein
LAAVRIRAFGPSLVNADGPAITESYSKVPVVVSMPSAPPFQLALETIVAICA